MHWQRRKLCLSSEIIGRAAYKVAGRLILVPGSVLFEHFKIKNDRFVVVLS
jgi:hypothetical protein